MRALPRALRMSGPRYILPIGAAVAAVSVAGATLVAGRPFSTDAYQPSDLPKVEARVRADYPRVGHLSPDAFAGRLGKPADQRLSTAPPPALVFDVRAPQEYAVSHLPGAIRVEPDISADRFLAEYGDRVAGREVVFYCSVGVRSSKLAERLAAQLAAHGARAAYNLEGGLFRWHNEGRAVVDSSGPTDRIHPFDSYWGGLIARRDRIATEP